MYKLVNVFLFFLLYSMFNFSNAEEKSCTIIGTCQPCREHEKKEDYCKSTQFRQEVFCYTKESDINSEVSFLQSCTIDLIEEPSLYSFYLFEGIIAGVLLVAGYLVMKRKRTLAQIHDQKIAKLVQQASKPTKLVPVDSTEILNASMLTV